VHERAEIGVAAEKRPDPPDGAPTAPRLLYPPPRGRAGRSGALAVERIPRVDRYAARSHTPTGGGGERKGPPNGRRLFPPPLPTTVVVAQTGLVSGGIRALTLAPRAPIRLGFTRAALERPSSARGAVAVNVGVRLRLRLAFTRMLRFWIPFSDRYTDFPISYRYLGIFSSVVTRIFVMCSWSTYRVRPHDQTGLTARLWTAHNQRHDLDRA